MLSTLNRAFETVLEISWQAGVLVVLILAAQWIFRNRLAPKWRCAMWGLLLIRLAMPVMPQSDWNIWALTRSSAPAIVIGPAPMADLPVATQAVRVMTGTSMHPMTPTPRRMSWVDWLACLWAGGVVMAFMRSVVSCARFRRRVQTTGGAVPQHVSELLQDCCREVGIRRVPQILLTPCVMTPSVFGGFRPILLLPPGVECALNGSQLRYVILHELMHIQRRDVLVGMVFAFCSALHWFNPLIRLGTGRFRIDRELACDAAIVHNRTADARLEYGAAILRVLECLGAGHPPVGAVSVVGSRSSVRARLSAIARPVRSSTLSAIVATLLVTLIGCATFSQPRQAANPGTLRTADGIAQRSQPVTRSYPLPDIQRILRFATQASAFRQAGTQPGTLHGEVQVAAPASMPAVATPADVPAALAKVIEPTSWRRGGGNGSAELRGDEVAITQTPRVHDILRSMIQFGDRQIQVSTRFITSDGAKLKWEQSHGDRWMPYGELRVWGDALSADDVDDLLKKEQGVHFSTILTAPRLTVFNGQRAVVVVSTETAYVKDLIPALSGDTIEWEPVVGVVDSGVTLNCLAQIALDGKTIILNLNPRLQRLRSLVAQPVNAVQKDGKTSQAFIQIPQIETIEFDRTIPTPSGQTKLIKVGSIVGEVERSRLLGTSVEPHEQNFYLLVSATILSPENQQ